MSLTKQRRVELLILLLLVALFAFAAPRIVKFRNYANSDFFSFWLAAHMTWLGQNPYQPDLWIEAHDAYGATWVSDSTSLYPSAMSVVLAPLGLFPLFEAFVLWVFVSLLAVLASLLVLRSMRPGTSTPLSHAIPMIAGALLFRPVILTLLNGQISGLLLWIVVLAICSWERERWLVGGALIGLTLLKPSLGLPVAGLFGVWAVVRKDWRLIVGIGIGIATVFIVSQLRTPGWLLQYVDILSHKGGRMLGIGPTLWGLMGMACRDVRTCVQISGLVVSALILTIVMAVFIRWRRSLSPRIAAGIVLSATLCVTPYLWGYDQILLLVPIIVLSLELRDRGFAYLTAESVTPVFSLFSLLLVYVATLLQRDGYSAFLSLLAFIAMIWVSRKQHQAVSNRKPFGE